jgi:hypothetical protein
MVAAMVRLTIGSRDIPRLIKGAKTIFVHVMGSSHRSHAGLAARRISVVPAAVSIEVAFADFLDIRSNRSPGAETDHQQNKPRENCSQHDRLLVGAPTR